MRCTEPGHRARVAIHASRPPSAVPLGGAVRVAELTSEVAHEFMRLLAYAILILGFVWICFLQLEIRPITRSVLVAQANKIPKKESYSTKSSPNSCFTFLITKV